MTKASNLREKRLRKTKAQLVDELEALEHRIEGCGDAGRLLTEALECIPDGFSYYDADDSLILCNNAHKNIFRHSGRENMFNASYEDLLQLDVAQVADEEGGDGRRRRKHRRPDASPFEIQLADDRWIQVRNYQSSSGGLVSIQSDVTELKHAEKELRESERRYESITANIPGVVYERALHPDGSISFPYVSAGLRETHGLDPEEVKRDPALWLAMTHPDDRERLEKSNAESIRNLEDWNLEYRIITRGGKTKWVRGTSHVQHEASGDVIWDGVLLDVTEEHLSQQRISDLARFPSENPNPVIRVKPNGKVLYANKAARMVPGLIVGGKRSMLTRKLGKGLDEVVEDGKRQEQRFTFGERMYLFAITPILNESYINIYCGDITEEHRARQESVAAQETSAAVEALLRDAIDNISDGFVIYDSNGRLVTCNQKWKDIYGYSDEDAAPGVKYEDLVRLDLEKAVIADHSGQAESYYKQRLAYRKEQEGAFEVELADGRWILIRERRTSSGDRVGIQADITERKRAEQALRESEERYALVMGAIEEGIYEWNVDTDEFYTSGIHDILGLPVEEQESREAFLKRVHADDRQRFHDAYVALFKGETERLHCDVRYRDSKGDWRTARQHAVALRDENGRVHRVIGASGDITELMQREQALRDSREMLSAVVNAVPAMINAKDRDSRYVLINRYQAELYGVSEDEAIGKTAGNLLGGKYGAHTRKLDRKVITSGEAHPYFEEDHVDAHGVRRNLLAIKVPLKDKEEHVRGVVTVALDITDRKRAEQALRESEARFAQAARLANLGHWAWDEIEDECIYCSEELARIHGMTVDQYLETTRSVEKDLERVHPDDRDEYNQITREWRGQEDTYDIEYRIFRPDGELRHVRELAEAIRDDSGRLVRSIGTKQDITERKRTEEELAEKEAQLRAALTYMPGGMKLVDRDLNYVLFNPQYEEWCDFPKGFLRVGRSMRDELYFQAERGDFGPGDKDKLVEEVVDRYRKGEAVSVERYIPGGRTLQINFARIPEGGYVSILTDITARKLAEMEVRKSREQLQALADNLPEFISMKDSDEQFIFVNKQFEEWVCQSRDVVIGKTVYDIYGDDQANEFHTLDRQVIEGREVLSEEVDLTYPDGKARAIIRTRFPVISSNGEMLGLGTVNRDITERKRAEEALLEAKLQSEKSGELIAEKNQMLESLSNQLSKYLSPQVYASIFSGEQSVEIASKRKKLTVFFSDIADFTETTDSLEPEELTNLLNHYLTEMSKVALEYGATIDKYVGDGITAFFGDPESRGVKEDAKACVNMAIAMQRRMQELQSEWLERGLEKPFQIRIGINTGFCTVGNFGSEDRMDYTINGSEVNLAARLESRAEVGGILLAHETYSLVKDTVLAEERDALTVKGFAKPVRSYAVVGLYQDLADQGRIIRHDQEGLALVVDRDKLTKKGKADAIRAIKDVLSRLET